MEQTPTDPMTAGNFDKLWVDVTEDENLQQILHALLEDGTGEVAGQLAEWLHNNMRACAAVIREGRSYLRNGDPGDPPEYCDEYVAPECGEYCKDHQDWELR